MNVGLKEWTKGWTNEWMARRMNKGLKEWRMANGEWRAEQMNEWTIHTCKVSTRKGGVCVSSEIQYTVAVANTIC